MNYMKRLKPARNKKHVLNPRPFDLIIRQKANRVSKSAAAALRDILEDIGFEISRRAVDLATHAGRITVHDDDLRVAYSHWIENRK